MRETLGQNISYYRKLKGITQKELADEVGISTSFMSQVENNISNPSSENLEKIAEVIGVDISVLEKNAQKIDPISEMIEALIKLTKNNTIEWESSHPYVDPLDNSEAYQLLCYKTDVEGTLYKVCIKEKPPEFIKLYIKEKYEHEVELADNEKYNSLNELASVIRFKIHDTTYIYENLKKLKNLLGE